MSRILKVPISSLSDDTGLDNLDEWDSLGHTNIILELEDVFDISFDFEELDQIITIKEIVSSLKKKGLNID